ncbi:sarcolemmal membrane-associated protein [Gossypium australe]|uniref:Sarcolemmal membrane-associated protein n=1 Tax=Gossypium australe TaxID=47621 RepID=A0A5B6UG18_9ROSI|nr:sarcolemmal membrane-associated protein [Gossypium australe]
MAIKNEIITSTDLGDNEIGNISTWSIPKMISLVKSTFRSKDFAMVEKELLAREHKSKLEIESLKQEKDSFSYKFEEERLEKMGFADDLRKCKKELEDMRGEVSKLREENMVLRERGKSAEERCNRLSEEVKGMYEKQHEIINLRSKNCELENEKAKAESELEILRKRFEELDKRVLCLETGFNTLQDEDDSKNNNRIGGEIGVSENGRLKPIEANGYSPNAGLVFCLGVLCSVLASSFCPVHERGMETPHAGAKSRKQCLNRRTRRNLRVLWWGSGRPPSQNVVEIVDIDSDDDCAPVENPSVETVTPTLKRKQTSTTDVGEGENGDNDALSESLKMRKRQEPVCRPNDCPLNHCSTTTIVSDINEVNRGSATPREDVTDSVQPEHRTESQHRSGDLINGFPLAGLCFSEESSVSSDTDSDADSDGFISINHSQPAPEVQKENKN